MTTTLDALNLPHEEAIDFFRGKIPVHTQHWTDVWRTAHSRAFMVAGAASDALLSDFRAAIAKGLEQGTTLPEFRRDFDSIVAKHGWVHNGSAAWRSRIIYETNLSTAFSAGQYAQMTEPATLEAFPFWQYVHSGSAHPRLQHLAWNGLTLRADDPFWSTHYPPNGWRCGCRVRPLTERGLGRMGKRGPDTAPPAETRPWRNPRTGEVHQVPVGIDPGFDYNPGKAWKQGGGSMPATPADFDHIGAPATPLPPFAPPPFATPAAADSHLTEVMRPWREGLSDAESNAVDTWQHDPLAVEGADAKPLASALDRATMPHDLALFHPDPADALAGLKIGDIWRQPGFVGAAIDEAAGGKLRIRVRAGTPGVAYLGQLRAIIQRGSSFRVVEQGRFGVVLEMLPPPAATP